MRIKNSLYFLIPNSKLQFMLISYAWLQEYIPDLDVTPQEFANRISASLAEVEGYHRYRMPFEGVVIGRIEEIVPHPNADKLQVTKVTTGGDTLHTIVCGAPNISIGDYVPVILPGATLPNSDFTIERREIRGQVSEGMLCSAKELGISDDHTGILLLNNEPSIRVGQSFASIAKADDVIFEIENKALTHRPDAFSHIGMAREVAAAFELSLTLPKIATLPKPSITTKHSIAVTAGALCRRYSSIELTGITPSSSPLWLQLRLQHLRVRPINVIVDATNYVMLEYGQPTHAFDAEKLVGPSIIIRNATENETLTTLDGTERTLTTDMLVIADEKGPIALAGIMGGLTTEVTTTTNRIILESANFEHFNNRKTSRTLGIQTEASTRFAKNQDPNATVPALHRIVELLQEISSHELQVSELNDTYTQERSAHIVPFSHDQIRKVIGAPDQITDRVIKHTLQALGIEVVNHGGKLGANVPTSRPDISIPEDLAEEVARIVGYDNLTLTLPTRDLTPSQPNHYVMWKRTVKAMVARLGFTEVYNFTFVGKDLFERCGVGDQLHIGLQNPISPETAYLRPTLLPQLIENLSENANNGYAKQALFELEKGITPVTNDLPHEQTLLALATLHSTTAQEAFQQLKTRVQALAQHLNLSLTFYVPINDALPVYFHPNMAVEVFINKESAGHLGILAPQVHHSFGFIAPVAIAEISANALFTATGKGIGYQPVSPHPALTIDVSCVLDQDISLSEVADVLLHATSDLLTDITAVESISDAERFGANNKAVVLRCTFQAPDRTLSKKETAADIANLTSVLTAHFGGEVR